MLNLATHQCAHCGATPDRYRPALIGVVDETGTTLVCGLCVIQVLASLETSGDVTVLVSRPTAAGRGRQR